MATREENLKKINDELEQLSDEELENVAGGSIDGTVKDARFLYEHGILDDWDGTIETTFYWKSVSKKVDAGWAKAGITCVTKPLVWSDNQYFVGGKEITRDEAINIVKSKFKKIRDSLN